MSLVMGPIQGMEVVTTFFVATEFIAVRHCLNTFCIRRVSLWQQ